MLLARVLYVVRCLLAALNEILSFVFVLIDDPYDCYHNTISLSGKEIIDACCAFIQLAATILGLVTIRNDFISLIYYF